MCAHDPTALLVIHRWHGAKCTNGRHGTLLHDAGGNANGWHDVRLHGLWDGERLSCQARLKAQDRGLQGAFELTGQMRLNTHSLPSQAKHD